MPCLPSPLHRTCAAALLLAASAAAQADVCRVTPTGAGDGSTWPQASALQAALGRAECSEIWVAQGVYTPVVPLDPANVTTAERSVSFTLRPGQQVYGGFAGGETTRAARDFATRRSVLSGDIDSDGTSADGIDASVDAAHNANNSYHVVWVDGVTAGGVDASTVLDGFTITAGNADGYFDGGGLYCNGAGNGHQCSPTLRHLHFSGNHARLGGAVYNDGSDSGASSPRFSSVTFSGNRAVAGGAVVNRGDHGESSPSFHNTTFSGNSAVGDGGAIANYSVAGTLTPTFSNTTFSGNSAMASGGAIYTNAYSGPTSRPRVRHSVFSGNTAAQGSQAWTDGNAYIEFDGGLFDLGCDSPTGQGGSGGGQCNGTVLNTPPQLGPLQDNGGGTPTHLPLAGSPLIDAAPDCQDTSDTAITTDQRGVARPQGSACDIGAVERRDLSPGSHALTVTITGPGTVSGGLGACASTTSSCSANYGEEDDPATATLSATPTAGATFTGWGGACAGTGTCTVAMGQARSVTALFALNSYAISGNVSSLTGTGLVLRNGGEDLPIGGNGSFSFATPVAHGGSYAVTVQAQPTGQTCTVSANSSGSNVTADVGGVQVDCADTATPTALPVPVPTLGVRSLALLSALLGLLALRRRV